MAGMKVYLDPVGNVMNIWWGRPEDAHESVEVDDPNRNDVLVLDKTGKPISIELVGIFPKELNISEVVAKLGGHNPKEPFLLQA